MSYDALCEALAVAVASRTPVILWGDPGQGKTSVLTNIFTSWVEHLETIIPSASTPEDFSGLPEIVDIVFEGKTVKQSNVIPPGWAWRLRQKGDGGVLWDELSNASEATQAVVMNTILTRRIGELYLGDNVSMVCSANPTDQAANGWELALPLKNRLIHLDWYLPAAVVVEGILGRWPDVSKAAKRSSEIPAHLREEEEQNARVLVSTFLRARNEMVSIVPANNTIDVKGFPTPRSWEVLAKVYGYANASGVSSEAIHLLCTGIVGDVAGSEFLIFVDNLDLPDTEEVLANPAGWNPGVRGDQMYAVAVSVVRAVEENFTVARWHKATAVAQRILHHNYAEIAVMMMTRLTNLEERVTQHPQLTPNPGIVQELGPLLVAAGLTSAP